MNLISLGSPKMMRPLAAMASILILSQASMAMAGKIIIPVNQNQTAVNVGNQNQQAGSGNTTQTGVLQQDISQNQSVNIYVPESFQGKIQVRDGAQGQGNGNQRFERGEGRGNAYGYGRNKENDHRDHEGKGRGERGRD